MTTYDLTKMHLETPLDLSKNKKNKLEQRIEELFNACQIWTDKNRSVLKELQQYTALQSEYIVRYGNFYVPRNSPKGREIWNN